MKGRTKPTPAKQRRVRRSPEEARALILAAATRVFAVHLPDVVGLKDVAREAGVSHALVTHYFGTYSALVEATLEDRSQRLRAELMPAMLKLVASDADVTTILRAHRRTIAEAASDPATVRLLIWAMLSGRAAADDFFPHRLQGLKLVVDALSHRSKIGREAIEREDLEFLLIVSLALSITWKFAGHALAGALGYKPSPELHASFERHTEELIERFLRGRAH